MKFFQKFQFPSIVFFIVLLSLISSHLLAQQLKNTHNAIIEGYPIIRELLVLKNGKQLVYGSVNYADQTPVNEFFMLNADGSLDPSFQLAHDLEGEGIIMELYELADGKILIAGSFKYDSHEALIKINPDGSLDPDFKLSLPFKKVYEVDQQTDGKIILRGYGYDTPANIVRITPNGIQDLSFQPGEIDFSSSGRNHVDIQSDGKIVYVGSFGLYNDIDRKGIVRLHPDGSVDESLQPRDGFSRSYSMQEIKNVRVQEDGKILIVGKIHTYDNTTIAGLIRLNTDGSIDETFATAPAVNVLNAGWISDIVLTHDHKILLLGFRKVNNHSDYTIIKLNTDGSISTDFPFRSLERNQKMGYITDAGMVKGPEENFYAFGLFEAFEQQQALGLVAFDTVGNRLSTYQPDLGGDVSINSAVLQNNGQLIISGDFHQINGQAVNKIARINTDGSLDESFQQNIGTAADRSVQTLALQKDGKILIAGNFTSFNGTGHNAMLRLNSDGTIDSTFHHAFQAFHDGYVFDIHLTKSNKILVGGYGIYTLEDDVYSNYGLIQLQAGGSLDSTFNSVQFYSENLGVRAIHEQSNGKYLLKAWKKYYETDDLVVRVDSTGKQDETFNSASSSYFFKIRDIAVLPNDEFLMTGYISGGSSHEHPVLRLDKDGNVLDEYSIQAQGGAGSHITDIHTLPNSTLLLGGLFEKIGQVQQSNFGKVSLNGTLNTRFNFQTDGIVSRIIKVDNDHILISGDYTTIAGQARKSGMALMNLSYPMDPEKLTADYDEDPLVTLRWIDRADNEEGYEIWRAANAPTHFYLLDTLPADNIKYLDSTIGRDTTYYYKIRAFNKDIYSGFSEIAKMREFVLSNTTELSNELSIYPNPTERILCIETTSEQGQWQLQLSDLEGHTLMDKTLLTKGEQVHKLDLRHLKAGIYFIRLTAGEKTYVQRLIKK